MTASRMFKSQANAKHSTRSQESKRPGEGRNRRTVLTLSPFDNKSAVQRSRYSSLRDVFGRRPTDTPMTHQPKLTQFRENRDHRGKEITTAQVRDDITRVAQLVGRQPTEPEYRKYGIFSAGAVFSHFGGWNAAMEELDFQPRTKGSRQSISDEEALQALRDAAEELGHPPRTRSDALEHSSELYRQRFGSWLSALEKAGIDPESEQFRDAPADKVEFADVVSTIVEVATEVDRPPYESEVRERADFTARATREIAGTWAETLRMAGFPARYRGGLCKHPEGERVSDYGSNWERVRNRALSRDRFRCQHCGMQQADHVEAHGTQLHVHHIKPIRTFDKPEAANFLENLITLCDDCHRKWEPTTQKAMRDADAGAEAVMDE